MTIILRWQQTVSSILPNNNFALGGKLERGYPFLMVDGGLLPPPI
jgi:hypothetical protein